MLEPIFHSNIFNMTIAHINKQTFYHLLFLNIFHLYYNVYCLLSGVCIENDAMAPDSRNPVTASSYYGTVNYLKDIHSPRWESNPQEDGDENPTVTVSVSEENAYIREIFVNNTQNTDFVTVYIVDKSGKEVGDY